MEQYSYDLRGETCANRLLHQYLSKIPTIFPIKQVKKTVKKLTGNRLVRNILSGRSTAIKFVRSADLSSQSGSGVNSELQTVVVVAIERDPNHNSRSIAKKIENLLADARLARKKN